MKYEEFLNFLQNVGKDPSRLIFEDELTGIYNRRFLLNYFQYKVPWDALQENPLSLIMMDVDHFKKINDTYGHSVGDQALIWVAGLLKEVAADENLAIRYAGDEFMILVVRGEKNVALEMSKQLLRRVNEEPFRISQEDRKEERLRITLSMGIASAPEDAQAGKSLIQKADTALYYAKKEGRNRLANAGEIAPEEVFARTALHQLEGEKIAGRRQQLALAAEFLKKFGQGQSHFLIVEGAAGMGKSTFLETVWQNLAQNKKIWQAKVNGTPQETFRPYYLTTKILVELLNQRKDRGGGVFEKLNLKELAYLSHILPQLRSPEETPVGEEPRAMREGVFNTLVHFIPKVIESSPLALFIDDLDLADEATLLLLRQLMRLQQFPLFICSSSTNPRQFQIEGQEVPLGVFYQSYHQELDIHKINLTPLTAADITDHLRGVFPQVSIPASFEKTLEQITQGNPLFLGEILRKLVLEQKIALTGQQWIIEPLEIDYLPKSLEAIVSQKIAALDEESRQLLQQASAFGEDVSLSLLTGSSKEKEAKVLEFIDQAVAQGLIRSDFHFNDETIRFLGKRIREITDGAIQPDQKRKLHERIGSYQETLYKQNLLPSAATLAYHFKRSANQEKAKTYEQFQADYDQKIFSSSEVIQYVVERRSELPPPGAPLDPASLAQVPAVLRCLLTSLRNIKFYPPGSEAIITINRQVKFAIDPILEKNASLTIFKVRQSLMINGQKVDVSDFKLVAEELLKILDRAELQGIVFHQGLTEQEVEVSLEAIGRIKPKMIDKDYWQRFTVEQQLTHVELKQVRYTIMVEREAQALREKTSP
ncbi:MAG: diguanylate cyclase, partial [Deltaproteobacteria bacterium]|nr:diguanylate cyclase [Deltaproteobacteria bacterium]